MYSREQIEQVRSALDIVAVIREYVPSLTTAGRSVRGLCPFHNERTPSFHVQPEKGFYKCFGCGEAGDVISFLSKMESVSFSESLEKLAAQAGVVLRKEKNVSTPDVPDVKEKLYRLLEAALNFYEEQLWNGTGSAPQARAYLEERGVKDETTQKFRLGFAPNSGSSAFEFLVQKGFSIELCQQAGLVSRSAAGRFYDPLFGRLIFPILDSFGHVVGFGGRVLPQTKRSFLGLKDNSEEENSGPKYINSPETPVFSKGKLLYGLNQAKSAALSSRKVMIMEGYMDVVGAHQAGFTFAVAALGTAFTRDHAKLIKRYADEVIAFFDPDEAGQRAAIKGLEPLIQESLFPRVVMTAEPLDPDEIILQKGAGYFAELIEKAPDFVDYILKTTLAKGEVPLKERSEVAQQILRLIGTSTNEILKAEWTEKVSLGLGLNRQSLEAELGKKKVEGKPASVAPARAQTISVHGKIMSAEEEYLQLYFGLPASESETGLNENDFLDPRQRKLFSVMKSQKKELGKVSLPLIHEQMAEEDKDWLLTLFLEEKTFDDPSERQEQLVQSIRLKRQRERLGILSQQVGQGLATTAVQEEYKSLLRTIKGSRT